MTRKSGIKTSNKTKERESSGEIDNVCFGVKSVENSNLSSIDSSYNRPLRSSFLSDLSLYYSQSNLIIPELDDDPAILKVIHDSERLERETYRRELLKILKIQPTSNGNASSAAVLSEDRRTSNEETIATPPGSQSESDHRASQIWIKRSVPITPNSNSPRRQHYRSTLHQRSLNSSGESYSNRSLVDSPKSGQHSLMKSARSDTNLSLSPLSMNKTSPIQSHGKTATNTNISVTPSGTIVTDYRQSMTMKRIVNPQWNIIPFA